EDSTAPLPEPPINKQDLTSNYYYVYNYNHFIGMINLALETAFNLLIVDLLRLDYNTPLATTVSPFLDFDPHTNTNIFYADFFAYDEVYTGITGTPPVEIYFNERLYDLCIGLPTSRVSKTRDLNYKFRVINNQYNIPIYVPLNSTKIVDGVTKTVFELKKFEFVMIQQEISSIALWNPVASIIFASSLLPIQATQTSVPKDVGSNNNSFTGSGNNSNL
ncbi:MAG: phage minor capsid protein, partial [Candidatus Fonsibacter sp.]